MVAAIAVWGIPLLACKVVNFGQRAGSKMARQARPALVVIHIQLLRSQCSPLHPGHMMYLSIQHAECADGMSQDPANLCQGGHARHTIMVCAAHRSKNTSSQRLTSNMNARVSAGRCCGRLLSLLIALSKVAASGPCGVMHTCRLAPAQPRGGRPS